MRETSIEAYNQIKESGLLSEARFIVYNCLYVNGPATAGELFSFLKNDGGPHSIVKGSVCARLTELRNQGCAREIGKKVCSLTGKTAMLWDVTKNLPKQDLNEFKKIRCACCDGKGYVLKGSS